MGSWYMNLSDYMSGGCLWKFNSMGGGVKNKVPSSPSRYFFSGIALSTKISCTVIFREKNYRRNVSY